MLPRVPVFFAAAFAAVAAARGAALAQSPQTPAVPQPTTSPVSSGPPAPQASPGFSYSGTLRAYYFVRQNANQAVKNEKTGVVTSNPNRTAFSPGGTLHAEYRFGDSPFRIGTSYAAADPFDLLGPNPQKNTKIDNTLPGFPLSTFDEAYANYHTSALDATVGDRVFNFLWMPASDSRIKPASFQGIDINGKILPQVTVGVSRIIAYENRTDSAFQRATLLTSLPAGASGIKIADTSGALHAYLNVAAGPLGAHFENYSFYDIANLQYADATYKLFRQTHYSPFVALQYVSEHQTGRAVLGTIANNTIGVQVGAAADKNLSFAFGFDTAPTHYLDREAATAAAATKGIFLPGGGTTTSATVAPGVYRVAYGGIASPYSDTYASDPLYTTSITQGMADRRSAGTAFKLAATYLSNNKRLKAVASEAYYQYDNLLAENRTFEDDVDVQYFFNPVHAGLYKGFSLRERYANRSQPTVPDNFKYVRTQLEYDF
jgi:hypothetical protein